MKKQMPAGIAVIACIALCAAVLPRSVEVGNLPTETVKTAVTVEIEARPEETPRIHLSDDTLAPEVDNVAEREPLKTGVTAEEKTDLAPSAEPTSRAISKSTPASTEPKPGTIAIIDGNRCMWIPGFGWVKDGGGGSQGTMVGSPGDELTGNKVGQMGGSTIVDGKTGIILTNVDVTRPYAWSSACIADILENEVYLGHTINLQYTTLSYKNKKRIERPKSEHLCFENTHEPLVTKEIWDIV